MQPTEKTVVEDDQMKKTDKKEIVKIQVVSAQKHYGACVEASKYWAYALRLALVVFNDAVQTEMEAWMALAQLINGPAVFIEASKTNAITTVDAPAAAPFCHGPAGGPGTGQKTLLPTVLLLLRLYFLQTNHYSPE
jgi:hypothetical protein